MKQTFSIILALALTLLLGACSRGPDAQHLQQDLQSRVDNTLGKGLLQVQDFKRYGSQPLSVVAGDERQRIAIYYKAKLALMREHRFSDWTGQNISALHQALGSAAKGVSGVAAAGNQSGDILVAHGLSVYVDENKDWLQLPFHGATGAVDENPARPGPIAEIDAENTLGKDPEAIWQRDITQQLQQITGDLARQENVVDSASLHAELQSVLTRAKLKQLKSESQSVLLSGSPTGNYHALAQGVAEFPSGEGTKLTVVSSSGAIENISLIHQHLATFALTQSDLAASSFRGTGVFAGQRSSHLRALAALYPEPVQIVVRGDSRINSLADLAGKRVNIGADGTGTQSNARQILTLAEINDSSFSKMDITTAVAQLNSGHLDALFITGALPSRYLRGLDERVNLIPLDAAIIHQLAEQHGYVSYQIQPQAYPGVTQSISTLAVTAVLVADKRASNAQVTALLKKLFDSSDQRSAFGDRATSLDPSRALEGIAIPLHSAAAEFFGQKEDGAAI